MENTYRLIWSDRSIHDLKNIISYLEMNWAEKEIQKFAKQLNNQLSLIQTNPTLFPISPKSLELRRAVLSKQITVYYQIGPDHIRLITLFDNRQNPAKI